MKQAVAESYWYSEAAQRDYGDLIAHSYDQRARFYIDLIAYESDKYERHSPDEWGGNTSKLAVAPIKKRADRHLKAIQVAHFTDLVKWHKRRNGSAFTDILERSVLLYSCPL